VDATSGGEGKIVARTRSLLCTNRFEVDQNVLAARIAASEA
jgi:hypothetical protein